MDISHTSLDTLLLATLIGVVSWLGKRTLVQLDHALRRLDQVVQHLAILNSRTEKLEQRMTVEEGRHK